MIAARVAPVSAPVAAAHDPAAFASQLNDSALLRTCYGVSVVFLWEGCANYYPRQQMTGRVVDVRTRANGVRQVQVTCELLNLPKWVI